MKKGRVIIMDNCIFCKIIAGEIVSATVYEDEDFKAIMDISPAAKGHVILLAKRHAANLYELDEATAEKVLKVAQKIARAMQEELSCDGLNLLQNNGESAGQTIFHFHMHIIPRFVNDQVNMTWTHGEYAEGEASKVAEAIAKYIIA
ncbi:MAG TPA: HIT family protein [Mobilitalea sp.]|nr:HIT family protein [Mobilitalea sp.]